MSVWWNFWLIQDNKSKGPGSLGKMSMINYIVNPETHSNECDSENPL